MKKLLLLLALVSFTMNAQIIDEGFDDITTLTGWSEINLSDSPDQGWFQGSDTVFPAHMGDPTSFLGVNYQSTSGGATSTISNWKITPAVDLVDGNVISFFTRIPTPDPTEYPDRLEVRISTQGAASELPASVSDVGDYTMLVIEVNPTLVTNVYPQDWAEFTYTVSGIPTATSCKIAFRYWVTDAGPAGTNSNYVGIDTFTVTTGSASIDDLQALDFFYGPNPVVSSLNMKANTAIDNVSVLNLLGQEVLNTSPNKLQSSVDFSNLNAGVYLVKVQIGNTSGTFKVVKE